MNKIIIALLCFMSANAAAKDLCPKKIETTQTLDPSHSYDFEIIESQSKAKLKAIDFYDGHPNKMVMMIYDEEKKIGKETQFTWKFDPKTEYFYACVYSNTKLQLVKKINGFSGCTIYVNAAIKLDGYASINRIECK